MTRYRLTIRGTDMELRGYVDTNPEDLAAFAASVEGRGVVIASIAEPDYNPFRSA